MMVNPNVRPRELSSREKADRKNGIYDSFANYLVFCPKCFRVAKANMYIMRAEAYIDELSAIGAKCPECGECRWTLGYPLGSETGFVKF
jgi:hypothetical protein